MTEVEYRVRPVDRFVVTRWHQSENGSGAIETLGEYANHEMAYNVAYALCKAEHDRLGYPIDDPRIQYPKERWEALSRVPSELAFGSGYMKNNQ